MRANAGAQGVCVCVNGERHRRGERRREGAPLTFSLSHAPIPLPLCSQECHCMLFLTPDNDFAGTEREISLEEIAAATAGM